MNKSLYIRLAPKGLNMNIDGGKDLQERKVKESVYIRLAPKGLKMNRDEGKELSPLWIRIIANAQKPPHEPRPPREPWPRDNRPLFRVRRRATATSPLPRQSIPPLPAVMRPTPTLRSRRLVSTTPPGASNTSTVKLTIKELYTCSFAFLP